jgi:DNA repair protein RadC
MHVSIADLPMEERPRERMAVLIGTGRPGKSAIDLARELLGDGLRSLLRRDCDGGMSRSLGHARGARVRAALELGRRMATCGGELSEPLRDPLSLSSSLLQRYAHHMQERLGAIYLDSRNRVLREREVYVGTVSTATVSTRDVIRFALDDAATSVIVFHNHPSGDPTPSADDIVFTRKLAEAASLFSIALLDHLIVGASRVVSLKERGVM